MIHRDQDCQNHLKGLESYIMEELNVRTLTLAEEDSRYGVRLQAEPDNMKLGKRLKGDFKAVSPAIKKLTNKDLEEFQEKGEIEVLGHKLSGDDLKVCSVFNFSHFPPYCLTSLPLPPRVSLTYC